MYSDGGALFSSSSTHSFVKYSHIHIYCALLYYTGFSMPYGYSRTSRIIMYYIHAMVESKYLFVHKEMPSPSYICIYNRIMDEGEATE